MSATVEIYDKIALLLMEDKLITPSEYIKFLDLIKVEILL
jgi:hypothetical protein